MGKRSTKMGSSLISIVIALAIIGLIWFLMTKYKKQDIGQSNQEIIQEAGVDTSNYKTILDSTKKIINDAESTRKNIP